MNNEIKYNWMVKGLVVCGVLAGLTGCGGMRGVSMIGGKAPETVLDVQLQVRIKNVVTAAITSDDPVVRCHGLEILGEWNDIESHSLIRECLSDPIAAVRYAAAIAAGDVRDYTARPILNRLLHDESISVKLAAGYALERMGDDRFGRWFDSVLFGHDEQYAGQACLLLGKLGETALRTNSRLKLRELLSRKATAASVRLQAAEALAMLGDKGIVNKLLAYSTSGYADDRMLATAALTHLRTLPEALAMLTVLADDAQLEVRLAAIRGLGTLAEPERAELVVESLEYESPDGDAEATARVRGLAYLALGSLKRAEDSGRLYQAMASENGYLRVAAARAAVDYLKQD